LNVKSASLGVTLFAYVNVNLTGEFMRFFRWNWSWSKDEKKMFLKKVSIWGSIDLLKTVDKRSWFKSDNTNQQTELKNVLNDPSIFSVSHHVLWYSSS
jgi:hypothetical protein